MTAAERGIAAAGPSFLVAIPVYDHAATLRAVVQGVLEVGYPVLVVDDGSDDDPLARVSDLPIERIRLEANRGKGAAILAAAERARGLGYDALVTIDADGQHDPRDLAAMTEMARAAWPCLVIGARRMDGENVPGSSLFGRSFSNFWVRAETGKRLADTQSGYRIYPVASLTDLRYVSRRYTFEIEALVRSSWAGFPIHSVDVSVYYPPASERITHFRKFRDNARLSVLHAFLVARSLLPWPHRRLVRRSPRAEGGRASRRPGSPLAFLRRLCLEGSNSGELAVAAGMGVAIGALPIMPFGIATIVYLSARFRLNALMAVGTSNLCIPPFVPLLCIEAGHFMLTGKLWTDFAWSDLLSRLPLRLFEWLLGSLVVGPLLGLLVGAVTFGLVGAIRRGNQKSEASKETAPEASTRTTSQ